MQSAAHTRHAQLFECALSQGILTSDPPRLSTGAILILKCFSTILCMLYTLTFLLIHVIDIVLYYVMILYCVARNTSIYRGVIHLT
jgi:hypothetical protein